MRGICSSSSHLDVSDSRRPSDAATADLARKLRHMVRDPTPIEQDATESRPRPPFISGRPVWNEEHPHGRNARRLEHPRLAPAPRVGKFAEFGGPVCSRRTLTKRYELTWSSVGEPMPDDDIEMSILLLGGRFDLVCASALA